MTDEPKRVSAKTLTDFVAALFEKHGVPEGDAFLVADNLVAADLRGIDSHGVARTGRYLARLKKGLIHPTLQVSIVKESPSTLTLDGGASLGQPVGKYAMERTIAKAATAGVCITSVRNSNHYGIARYYSLMALPHDMIGISMTNTRPLAVPTYGREAILGTNPISFVAPAMSERPFVLDMATTVIPIGKVEAFKRKQQKLLPGWAVDQHGAPTIEPEAVLAGGGVLPLGGDPEHSGYKGYGLSFMVEILCAALSGSAFFTQIEREAEGKSQPSNIGHFFAAMKIEAFRPVEEFKRQMDGMIHTLRTAGVAEGAERIYIPGDKSFAKEQEYRAAGIPVIEPTLKSLRELGQNLGVTCSF